MKQYKKNYSMRCSVELHKLLTEQAEIEGRSVSEMARRAMISYLSDQGYDVEKLR